MTRIQTSHSLIYKWPSLYYHCIPTGPHIIMANPSHLMEYPRCVLELPPHLSFSKVQVHFLIRGRKGFQVVCAHTIDLQLEGQRWLKVPVDAILYESIPHPESEIFWMAVFDQENKCYTPHWKLLQWVKVSLAEFFTATAQMLVITFVIQADCYIQNEGWLIVLEWRNDFDSTTDYVINPFTL